MGILNKEKDMNIVTSWRSAKVDLVQEIRRVTEDLISAKKEIKEECGQDLFYPLEVRYDARFNAYDYFTYRSYAVEIDQHLDCTLKECQQLTEELKRWTPEVIRHKLEALLLDRENKKGY